jgi:hypothetical protein
MDLTAVLLKIQVFWKVTLHQLVNSYRCLEVSKCIRLLSQITQEIRSLAPVTVSFDSLLSKNRHICGWKIKVNRCHLVRTNRMRITTGVK